MTLHLPSDSAKNSHHRVDCNIESPLLTMIVIMTFSAFLKNKWKTYKLSRHLVREFKEGFTLIGVLLVYSWCTLGVLLVYSRPGDSHLLTGI